MVTDISDIQLTHKQTIFWDVIFDHVTGHISNNQYNEFGYFGGFGSGKSMVTMLATYTICAMYPKTHWLYCRNTYPELKDSVIPQFLDLTNNNGYVYKKVDRNMEFENGSVIYFRAFDTDTKILSNQYHGVTFCQAEEIPYELYLQTLGRLRLKGLGKNIILMEGNPAGGWVKDRLKDNPLPANTFLVEAKTQDNPYLSKTYIQRLIDNYPESWVRRYVYGEWSNVDEMVFSEFMESKHLHDVIDIKYLSGWRKIIGMDYGWRNPSAMVWCTVDYDGNVIIFDEFMDKEQTPDMLLSANLRHGKMTTVCDYSIKRPDRDGRSLWDDLCSAGMLLTESNKQELQNITLINTMLKQGRLRICKNCVELIKQIRNYKWKKVKLGEEKHAAETPIDRDNHLIDAMLYVISDIEGYKSLDPEISRSRNTLAYSTMKIERKSYKDIA